ncbi:LPXTG cell wall anchor domain-containing protein [Gillisia sp. Hel_I_29]|uniref:LPXTG cell wall anchor domain-containing protein n=1 Tax=Gillisia sp. Hel_I_29 TaxID=1249975 RepID=UPI0005579C34|nr:LPXTG cell wall anchor domain-containing protein [Gillisia sp. Hel_I_29]
MNNTLKIVLLILGFGLVGYGLYTLFTPEVSLQAGPLKVEAQGDNTQSYAMIGLGILSLIGGLAFRKR